MTRTAEPAAPADGDVLELLTSGELEILGQLPRSSNFTFLAKVSGADLAALAVYKPRDGEAPLWDFPEGTLHRREVAAYVLAGALGWPSVPPTVLRDGPAGPGSVQLFVDFDPTHHYFTLREERTDDFRRIALFDVVANNADRKAGHCILAPDGRMFAIDHGVCFAVEPKLRTVIWDFVDEPIPPDLMADLRRLASALADGALREKLGGLVEPREMEATGARLDDLTAGGVFPGPGPGRPYPWPVV